jgi:DNA (cytosine-5)-methyltransferase 1
VKPLTFVSLFAGIGGFDLGLERAGMKCIAQVEIDPYCRAVLAKHWPDVPRHDDVRTFTPPLADVIAGGFPCQDVSHAGLRAGISASRSGLYGEVLRCLRLVPRAIGIMENVAALLGRGMGTVLGDLAQIGRDAEWDCVPAAAVGARHIRSRVFIVASAREVANTNGFGQGCTPRSTEAIERWRRFNRIADCRHGTLWAIEPDMDRVAYGVPATMDRKCALGNAVVPQVAEVIGRAIVESHYAGASA